MSSAPATLQGIRTAGPERDLGSGGGQDITRRRIYLQRLVGDTIVSAVKTEKLEKSPWYVVFFFFLYLVVATFVILNRSNIHTLYQINSGVEKALQETSFSAGNTDLYFAGISSRQEMWQWMNQVLIRTIVGTQDDMQSRWGLSLLSFNRVAPGEGVCTWDASLRLTLRRVKTIRNEDVTSPRFSEFYPRTWVAQSVPAGEARASPSEATEPMVGVHRLKPFGDGDTNSGDTGPTDVVWNHTQEKAGYRAQGGYIALVTMPAGRDPLVHLVDTSAEVYVNPAHHLCYGVKRSATLSLVDFFQSGFFRSDLGSLAIEFVLYNANLQSMSLVEVIFGANYAGVITQKEVKTETIALDVYSDHMRYFELAYLLMTVAYALAWLRRLYTRWRVVYKDPWEYLSILSITLSLTSLALWNIYDPWLQEYLHNDNFRDPFNLQLRVLWFKNSRRAAGLATMLIYLRMLQFLAITQPRVMLISRALQASSGNMIIYFLYTSVLLVGTVTFAQTYFAHVSPDFSTLIAAWTSCTSMSFGKTDVMLNVKQEHVQLRNVFYVPFMVFFYFVGVQMFNAIINYSYNMTSEEMEPIFQHDNREKRKARLAKKQMEVEGRGCWNRFKAKAWEVLATRLARRKKKPTERSNASAVEALQFEEKVEALDDESKVKIEASFELKDVKRKTPPIHILAYLIFVLCYLWFLGANANITDNFQINKSLRDSMERSISTSSPSDGLSGASVSFNEIQTLDQAMEWIRVSLHPLIFEGTPRHVRDQAQAQGISGPSSVCLKGWNCLVAMGREGARENKALFVLDDSYKKLLRITQRRSQMVPNRGRYHANTPDRARFDGGKVSATGADVSATMVQRRFAASVDPLAPPSHHEGPAGPEGQDNNVTLWNISSALLEFCETVPEGGETSYGGFGGLVCLLEASGPAFKNQLITMFRGGFFAPDTSALVIDFALQNSNQGLLTYVELTFQVLTSGVVVTRLRSETTKVLGLHMWFDNFLPLSFRLVPGMVYLVLTCVFIYLLHQDFKYFKLADKGHGGSTGKAVIRFFKSDVFNVLEIGSICVSLWSMVIFVLWIGKDSSFQAMQKEPYTTFLDFCTGMASLGTLYNRLSAANILMIGVRPLKFVRLNERFTKLFLTMARASDDLFWFVVMLAITMVGFVMLVHIIYGSKVKECSTIFDSVVYCFRYTLGDFDFSPLMAADPLICPFFFLYLVLMYSVFTSVFFAIIDRHWIRLKVPRFQWKMNLKPLFGRICRCIDWDEDLQMEDSANATKKSLPPTRRDRVRTIYKAVQAVSQQTFTSKRAALPVGTRLIDVCHEDDQLDVVMTWSQKEARNLMAMFKALQRKKENAGNEVLFVRRDVMARVREEVRLSQREIDDSARLMRYSVRVREQAALQDQEILATYICVLEHKIHARFASGRRQEVDVGRLRFEARMVGGLRLAQASDCSEEVSLRDEGGGAGQPFQEALEAEDDDADPPPEPISLDPCGLRDPLAPVAGEMSGPVSASRKASRATMLQSMTKFRKSVEH